MTALLDEGAPGIGTEPIPVADFGQKREPMLSDRHHVKVPDVGCLLQEARNWRHEPVLQPHPHDPPMSRRSLGDAQSVFNGGRERLLDQHMHVGVAIKDQVEHSSVGEVGCGNHDRVTEATRQQRRRIGKYHWRWPTLSAGSRTLVLHTCSAREHIPACDVGQCIVDACGVWVGKCSDPVRRLVVRAVL